MLTTADANSRYTILLLLYPASRNPPVNISENNAISRDTSAGPILVTDNVRRHISITIEHDNIFVYYNQGRLPRTEKQGTQHYRYDVMYYVRGSSTSACRMLHRYTTANNTNNETRRRGVLVASDFPDDDARRSTYSFLIILLLLLLCPKNYTKRTSNFIS